MSSNDGNDGDQPLSLAAARLERQNKRIEVANAALTAQPPAEKQRQVSKGRSKVWKPFDFTAELDSTSQTSSAPPSVVESRVNVFRAPSQTGPLSRSVSRLSQQTFDSAPSDSDRRDSSFLESDDFQLFTGRKNRKTGAPNMYEDRSEPQQATVEASFNKREICNIFGNELPGPSFMDGNPGSTNGQLQFIQHPNGDISAHLWSASRYEWENLGQFSNIRKRVEGQLAADRLKGETAWQALQQHTLAYFRIIAKQREAATMGLPFGPRDISAALPDQPPAILVPVVPKKSASSVEMPAYPGRRSSSGAELPMRWAGQGRSAEELSRPKLSRLTQAEHSSSSLNFRLNPELNFTPTPREVPQEDPFVTHGVHRDAYDNAKNHAQIFTPSPQNMQSYHMMPTGQPSYNQSRSFLGSNYLHRGAGGQEHYFEPNQYGQQSAYMRHHQASGQPHQQYNYPGQYSFQQYTTQETAARPTMEQSNVFRQPPQAKAEVSPESRTAMRNSVMNLREQAEERTKSQSNIRTVLHDPYSGSPGGDSMTADTIKHQPSPTHGHSTNHTDLIHLPGLGLLPHQQQQRAFTTTLTPTLALQYDSTSTTSCNDLRDSSPDREWQRKPAESYDIPHHPDANPAFKKWDPTQLNDWWWSGTKFARQEEFFQNVKATDAPTGPRFGTTITARAPSSLPSTAPQEPAYNEAATRLLIPVLENLASYVQGPAEKRRDYFSKWVKAPEWAIDRGPRGNESFFDREWGAPPPRIGRDPRYRPLPNDMRFGSFEGGAGSPGGAYGGGSGGDGGGLGRRFGFGLRF